MLTIFTSRLKIGLSVVGKIITILTLFFGFTFERGRLFMWFKESHKRHLTAVIRSWEWFTNHHCLQRLSCQNTTSVSSYSRLRHTQTDSQRTYLWWKAFRSCKNLSTVRSLRQERKTCYSKFILVNNSLQCRKEKNMSTFNIVCKR